MCAHRFRLLFRDDSDTETTVYLSNDRPHFREYLLRRSPNLHKHRQRTACPTQLVGLFRFSFRYTGCFRTSAPELNLLPLFLFLTSILISSICRARPMKAGPPRRRHWIFPRRTTLNIHHLSFHLQTRCHPIVELSNGHDDTL